MTARARCTFVVMVPYRPLTALETHEVSNQPPPLVDFNAFDADRAIQDGVSGSGAGLHKDRLGAFGELVGRAETLELGRLANENPPTLKGFDRFGQRLDEVEFHPAYHALMQMGIAEFGAARGANNRLNEHIVRWERWSVKDAITESTARAFVEDTAAERLVAMLSAKVNGEYFASELPAPSFPAITSPAPVVDMSKAKVAIITDGGLVPAGNPDNISAWAATNWGAYDISGKDGLQGDDYEVSHRGYDTRYVEQSPDRLVPVDALRELEESNIIGELHNKFFSTSGLVNPIANSRRLGREIAEQLKESEVDAVILTST